MSASGVVSIAFAKTGFVLLCTIPSEMLPPNNNDLIEMLKDHIARRFLLPPLVHPQIEYVMQVEIGKNRRYHRPLRCPFLRLLPPALLHHARLQPFPDQAHDAVVSDPMLDELDHPTVFDFIEE